MFIPPIGSMFSASNIEKIGSGLENITGATSGAGTKDLGFKDILGDLIGNVEKTEAITKADTYNLSIGNMDDMHTMMINSSKAEMALQTMVQLRNKVMESYQSVMSTSL